MYQSVKLFSVFRLDINRAYSAAQNSNFGAVMPRLDHHRLFFDACHLTDDAAYGRNFISDLKRISHIIRSFFLLFLRTIKKKIEYWKAVRAWQ